MRAPDVKVVLARTVVLPATVEAYELDSGGERLDQGARAKALEKTIAVEFERQARTQGALPLAFDKVQACGETCTSQLSTAIRWGAKAAREIAEANGGSNPSGRSSIWEWKNGRDLRPLQRAMGADFALVFFVRDVRESSGQRLVDAWPAERARKAIHKEEGDFKRILVACALELASGRMVWCSSIVDRWTDEYVDITLPDESRRLVKELLTGF